MVLGFYIAAPLGAISIIYIKRTLKNGKLSGIVSALGVTTAETFYASAAIYGLSFITNFLTIWKNQLKLFGCLFLLYIGIKSFFVDPIRKTEASKRRNLLNDYLSMLFLSILNPIAIVGFVAIFASFGAGTINSLSQAFLMLLGFTSASFLYCLFLILIADALSSRFQVKDKSLIEILNKVSGAIIILFTIAIYFFSFSGA